MTKEKLTDELNKELTDAFPGAIFNFSQMISDNVEEAVSGVKGENSVKVFGNDLESNEKIADAIVDVMGKVPGHQGPRDVPVDGAAEHQDHAEARRVLALRAQHGGRGRRSIQAAIGGQAQTEVYEGEKRFDLTVRWKPQYRTSLEAIRETTVSTPDGAQVPLGQLADIQTVEGPAIIYREDCRAVLAGQVQRPRAATSRARSPRRRPASSGRSRSATRRRAG